MFFSIDEIKDLIIFCGKNKVKNMSVGNLSIEISDYAHLESMADKEVTTSKITNNLWVDSNLKEQAKEDEELLYHSSIP